MDLINSSPNTPPNTSESAFQYFYGIYTQKTHIKVANVPSIFFSMRTGKLQASYKGNFW